MSSRNSPRDEEDEIEDDMDDELEAGNPPRWVAASIMLLAVGGFAGLAWYAYHSGTHSLDEGDLPVVEADASPVREQPADPGGMKFPHQDKAIFGALAPQDGATASVERVLPAPEEPVAVSPGDAQQAGGARSWVNESLNGDSAAREALIEEDRQPPAGPRDRATSAAAAQAAASMAPAAGEAASDAASASDAAKENAPPAPKENAAAESGGEVTLSPTPPAVKEKKPVAQAKAAPAPKKSTASGLVQLGAYRSEAEARRAWETLQGKHTELKGAKPDIVRADLGAKGVFYRLRAGVESPQQLCQKLAAQGQACMAVRGG